MGNLLRVASYFLGGDYMIPVGRDKILCCFAGIPAVISSS